MKRGMPVSIWRFLLADLARLGLLACVSLVLVIAFAFSVRFLAEGKIDLPGALRLTTLATVPMLQYALPFACGFAATLTYHRFAAENEHLAAGSGGISHRGVLVPACVIGVILSLLVAALSHQVIPKFLRRMEEIVTRDLTALITLSIRRGESVRLGNVELHAEQVVQAGADPTVGAFERLRLTKVLAATLDRDGRVQGFISADEVSVWLYQVEAAGQSFTEAQFLFRGASGEGAADTIRSGSFASQRVRIPSNFRDDPKFLTFSELRALRAHPENLKRVDLLRRRLASRLAENISIETAAARVKDRGEAVFQRPGGERITISADALESAGDGRWLFETRRGVPVRIVRTMRSGAVLRLAADAAWLKPEDDDLISGPRALPAFTLTLDSARSDDTDAPDRGSTQTLSALTFDSDALPDLLDETVPDLLALATSESGRLGAEASARSRDAATLLRNKALDLSREITSKQHERAAYAAACFLTLLAGAVTALRRRESLPLPVYLWSFFPALGAVITISAGQGLTHSEGWPGLFLLWGGVALLALVILVEYRRLVRH